MMQISHSQVLIELERHSGAVNGIHVRDLVQRITGQLINAESLERKVRDCIVELRMQGHPICGHPSTGYYLAATEEELNDSCEFLYQRAMTSLTQISRLKQRALPDFRGQLGLPATPKLPVIAPGGTDSTTTDQEPT